MEVRVLSWAQAASPCALGAPGRVIDSTWVIANVSWGAEPSPGPTVPLRDPGSECWPEVSSGTPATGFRRLFEQ
jgi:hypothetical protein